MLAMRFILGALFILVAPSVTIAQVTTKQSDPATGNVYVTTHNADGTTDVVGSNPGTGAVWGQNIDPKANLQYGIDKHGESWIAPLTVTPSNRRATSPLVLDDAPVVVFEPSPHDRWLDEWRHRSFNGPFGEPHLLNDDRSAQQPERDLSPATRQSRPNYDPVDAFQEERAKAFRAAAPGGAVLSKMQPSSLAEAARAAARNRCMTLTIERAKAECLKEAEAK